MKQTKRILSVLTAGAVLCGAAVISGSYSLLTNADSETTEATETTESTEEEVYTYDSLTYVYLEDGTIEISSCTEDVTAVEIPSAIDEIAVTSIGSEAFAACTALADVTIPESITNIDGSAFLGTPWLETKQAEDALVVVNNLLINATTATGDVVIPDEVVSIESLAFTGDTETINTEVTSVTLGGGTVTLKDSAFYHCEALTTITLSDSLTTIGASAFADTAITEMTIPASVTDVAGGAFAGAAALTAISVDASNTAYTSEDGILFDVEKTTIVAYPANKEGTEYTVSAPITTIGAGAFASAVNLQAVVLSESVTAIEDDAFAGCSALGTITILNADCVIADGASTISNSVSEEDDTTFGGIIYGYRGSTASLYAAACSYNFVPLDGYIKGDLNADNQITIQDAADCLNAYANVAVGNESGLTEAQEVAADIDEDGAVTILDAYYILRYYAEHAVGNDITWEELIEEGLTSTETDVATDVTELTDTDETTEETTEDTTEEETTEETEETTEESTEAA